jgi:hypothetical protein
MAKVYGPLGGTMASGKLGRAVVYGNWRGIAWARAYRIPHNPRSPLQQAVRLAQRLAVQAWKSLPPKFKGAFNIMATVAKSSTGQGGRNGRKMSGYNLFVGLSRRTALWPALEAICDLAIGGDGSFTFGTTGNHALLTDIGQCHYSARPWFKWSTATAIPDGGTPTTWKVPAPFVDVPAGTVPNDLAVVLDVSNNSSGAKVMLASNYTDGKLVENLVCPTPP